jgi:transposase
LGRGTIEPNFENATLEELEVAMKCARSKHSYLRMRTLWTLARGFEKKAVSEILGIDYSTLLDWIHAFNERGIDGLIDRPRSGRPRKMAKDEVRETVLPLLDDPAKAGQEHWTAVKLHGHLKEALCKDLSYQTLLRYMHENGRVLKVPRAMPEPVDRDLWQKQREEFAQELGGLIKDPAVQLWFGDESGIEGDPRPCKQWAKKGSKPTIPYAGTHLRRNVVGAVCPKTGHLSCMIFSHCDSTIFQVFLDNMAHEQPPERGKRLILVLDNASWHKVKSLNWHHIEPMYLPPYSPDFNPIERFWLRLKDDFFRGFFARKAEVLEERIVTGLRSFFEHPGIVVSQCAISANF